MSEASENQLPHSSHSSHSSRTSNAIAISALIIGCIALGGTALNFMCSAQNKSRLQELNASLLTLSQSQTQQYQSLQTSFTQLKNSTQHATKNKLAEISYLIRLANLQLTISQDAPAAIKTLLDAQQQLSLISDNAVDALKQALSANITALQAVPTVDTNDIISKLNEINELNSNLSPLPEKPTVSVTQTINAMKSVDATLPWYKRIWEGVKSLKTLFVIRHLDQPSVPLVEQNEANALKMNMSMELNIAQWAVLHKQQPVFQSTLSTVSNWLLRYFPVSDLRNQIEGKINVLQKMDIRPALPSLSETLTTLAQAQQMDNTTATPSSPTIPPVEKTQPTPSTDVTPPTTPTITPDKKVQPNNTDKKPQPTAPQTSVET